MNKYAFLSLIWAGLIWTASSIPGSELPGELNYWSYVAHVVEFGVLGFLLSRARLDPKKKRNSLNIAIPILLGVAYGALDEFHQLYVPGRSVDALDWLMDVWGVVLGVWLGVRARKKIT